MTQTGEFRDEGTTRTLGEAKSADGPSDSIATGFATIPHLHSRDKHDYFCPAHTLHIFCFLISLSLIDLINELQFAIYEINENTTTELKESIFPRNLSVCDFQDGSSRPTISGLHFK